MPWTSARPSGTWRAPTTDDRGTLTSPRTLSSLSAAERTTVTDVSLTTRSAMCATVLAIGRDHNRQLRRGATTCPSRARSREVSLLSWTAPVTLFAVRGKRKRGTVEVTAAFREVAAWFSNLQSYEWDPMAEVAGDDFAYTVCLERYTASINGGPPQQAEYRSTHVFRREAEGWRAVHRHADRQPAAD